ncbi:MAG: ABC transporter ATP-binding protein [Bacteroidota bacterium]|nr:ABC transporter ATP-binding protein [Bacteroidota bacterium]
MNNKNLILSCTNIHKYFSFNKKVETRLHVLRGIDISIFEGELVSIIGASGAGKSTLLHILGGLDRPTAGDVFWGTENISRLDDDELAGLRSREVGFVFQFHHLLPEFTALENVAIPQMILGKSYKKAEEEARKYLTNVGLSGRLSHRPSELSGGEQQRVAIARAVVNQPRVVFADELTGNLDSTSANELFNLIEDLNKNNKQTFVIVTHNEKLAGKSNRVLYMEDGKLK